MGYIPQLDGLRAVAVGAVMVGHAWPHVVPGGGVGVSVFFALSGYLITSLLIAERVRHGRIDYPRFYGRRFVRLVPALVLMVAVTVAVLRPPWGNVAAALLYYANWWRIAGHEMHELGHTWSLAIEEQFYLVWPLILAAAYAVWRVRGVAWAALGLSVVSILIRASIGDDTYRMYNGLDTRMDSLLSGALVAAGLRLRPALVEKVCRWVAVPSLVVLSAQTFWGMVGGYQLGQGVQAWACAALVGWLVTSPGSWGARALSWTPLVWLGLISYGLYLWHFPVQHWFSPMEWMTRTMLLPCVAVVTVLLSLVSYRFAERPLTLWLRPHLVPRARASEDAQGA